jgi:hypothetical protein
MSAACILKVNLLVIHFRGFAILSLALLGYVCIFTGTKSCVTSYIS